MGRELRARDADAGGHAGTLRGLDQRLAELPLPRPVALEACQIEIDHAPARVLDAWRQRFADLEEILLGGELARRVPAAHRDLGQERARLGQRHPTTDAGAAGAPARGVHPRRRAVAGEQDESLAGELGLAAQARREREEGHVKTGESGAHARKLVVCSVYPAEVLELQSRSWVGAGPRPSALSSRSRVETALKSLGARPVPRHRDLVLLDSTTTWAVVPLAR